MSRGTLLNDVPIDPLIPYAVEPLGPLVPHVVFPGMSLLTQDDTPMLAAYTTPSGSPILGVCVLCAALVIAILREWRSKRY